MNEVRLSDVAEYARVSIATVSRVLNHRSGVARATRDRVTDAMAELGYAHRTHRRSGPAVIGVIVPELHNPVFPAFAQELSTLGAARGIAVVVGTQTDDGLSERQLLGAFVSRGIRSVVVVSGQHADSHVDPDRYRQVPGEGVDLVLINGYLPGVPATFISHDEAAGMDLAVRHLADLGHRRIALATGPLRYTPAIRKADGFRAAVRTYLSDGTEPRVSSSFYSLEGGAAAARELIAEGYTAIVCGSDLMAIGAISAAKAMGRDVPGEVSIVGSDDSLVMAHMSPALTTIRQPIPDMAHAAVVALTSDAPSQPRPELLFGPELIVRESTGPSSMEGES